MAEALESPLIRVPYESLKRTTRERKYAIDEVEAVLKGLKNAAHQPLGREAAAQRLDAFACQLRGIKRKLDEASGAERDDAQRCCERLIHLRALGNPARDAHIDWNRPRLDRLLVDHLLRSGYHGAAAQLARAAGLEALTDGHVFDAVRCVTDGLQARQCGPALEWCERQRARLRKARSPLEFRLRVQEYVEVIRQARVAEAITYARRHLAPWAAQHGAELQHAAAALAFGAGTRCALYAALFADERWEELQELFRCELYRLHSMPPASQLAVHLQAGLSALKTPQSMAADCAREDPLHLPAFKALAAGLPYAKHVHSKLVCVLSGRVMDEDNPPMVLPNGYVYSEAALREAAERAGGGALTCPLTGDTFELSQLRRAFI